MKKQFLAAASLLMLGILTFTACKKKDNDPGPGTPTSELNNAQDFVKKYGAQKQTINFNTSELPRTFLLEGGIQITIQPNSLTIGGVPVSGDLTMEAYGVMKRSKTIFTGTNTNHESGRPLASDGFFFIDVKQNGTSVDQMLAMPYNVKVPTTRNGEFTEIWTGITNAGGQDQMAWQAPLNGGADSVKGIDSLFNFDIRNLGWVNCDVFYADNSPKTTVTVTLLNNPGTFATYMGITGETFVFYCPQGENVTAQLYTVAGVNSVKSYDNSMPIGSTGRLFAFCVKDGRCYMARQEVTILTDMNATLDLAEVTEEALAAEIESLDIY